MVRKEVLGEMQRVGLAARQIGGLRQDLRRLEIGVAAGMAARHAGSEVDAVPGVDVPAVHDHGGMVVLRGCRVRAHRLRHRQ